MNRSRPPGQSYGSTSDHRFDSASLRRRRPAGASARGRAVTLILSLTPFFLLSAFSTVNPGSPPERPHAGGLTIQEVQGPDAAELFKRQCVACHGKKGEGDGPAAIALKPPPANLTDPERVGPLSDEELVAVITNGRGSMPSFGSLLETDEIRALVRYIRHLSGVEDQSGPRDTT